MNNAGPKLDPETLERLRRGVPLRMNAMGMLHFDNEVVSHPRVLAALRAGLDTTPQGEAIVWFGAQWCYLSIDDCPLRTTAVHAHERGLWLRLDDARTLPLDPSTLWEQPDRGLRCAVPSSRSGRALAVRFTNTAAMDLAHWVESDARTQAPILVMAGLRLPITSTPPVAHSESPHGHQSPDSGKSEP